MNQHGQIALKGFAMGMADLVPGVSGGTIAFIAGIYDPLLAPDETTPLQKHHRTQKQQKEMGQWRSMHQCSLIEGRARTPEHRR